MSEPGVAWPISPHEVRQATRNDKATIVGMMVRAFDDDPFANWMILQDRKRVWRFECLFGSDHLRAMKGGRVETAGFGLGAAYWFPPNSKQGFTIEVRSVFATMQAFGFDRYERVHRALRGIFQGDPVDPHWALAALGVEPSLQGQGIGSSLMSPVLDECDRTSTDASLVCSKQKNIQFYERHGFRVIREVELPEDGPTVWRMWRKPLTYPAAGRPCSVSGLSPLA